MNKKRLIAYLVPIVLVFVSLSIYLLIRIDFISISSLQGVKSIKVPLFKRGSRTFTEKVDESPFSSSLAENRNSNIFENTEPDSFVYFVSYKMKNWNTSEWNYKTDYIYGIISEYNGLTNQAFFELKSPKPEQLLKDEKYLVTITCDQSKTVFLTTDRVIVESDKSASMFLEKGPMLVYSRCQDESCANLGPFCALVAFPSEN